MVSVLRASVHPSLWRHSVCGYFRVFSFIILFLLKRHLMVFSGAHRCRWICHVTASTAITNRAPGEQYFDTREDKCWHRNQWIHEDRCVTTISLPTQRNRVNEQMKMVMSSTSWTIFQSFATEMNSDTCIVARWNATHEHLVWKWDRQSGLEGRWLYATVLQFDCDKQPHNLRQIWRTAMSKLIVQYLFYIAAVVRALVLVCVFCRIETINKLIMTESRFQFFFFCFRFVRVCFHSKWSRLSGLTLYIYVYLYSNTLLCAWCVCTTCIAHAYNL